MKLKGHCISALPKAELERADISVVYLFNDAEVEEPASFPLQFFLMRMMLKLKNRHLSCLISFSFLSFFNELMLKLKDRHLSLLSLFSKL